MPLSVLSRYSGARSPVSGNKIFEEKAGQARDIDPLAGQVSGKMIASGWRTAPPQAIDIEVVLATNSACQQSLAASPRVPDPPCVAPGKLYQSTPRAELCQHLAPVIESSSRASAPRTLSAQR